MTFLTWYMKWKKEHPDVSLSQSKEVYDEIFVKNRIRWMGELGWSADEVRALPKEWASYLGVPEYVENLKANSIIRRKYYEQLL